MISCLGRHPGKDASSGNGPDPLHPRMLTRRRFLQLGGAAVAGAAGLGLYAWQIEPHWVDVVLRPMRLESLPPSLVGRTLLHVSDIHVGPRVSSAYLTHALDRARELAPDFVAFTGDFVTYRTATEYTSLARVLRHMPNGRLGTVAALGNHDYGARWRRLEVADEITRIAAAVGMAERLEAMRRSGQGGARSTCSGDWAASGIGQACAGRKRQGSRGCEILTTGSSPSMSARPWHWFMVPILPSLKIQLSTAGRSHFLL